MKARLLPALALLLLAAVTGSALAQPAKPRDCVAEMGPLPQKWEGTAFAIDGDTLAGVGLKPHIRIWGIQAPELRDKDKQETVAGMSARATLAQLLATDAQKVRCDPLKYDRYCRWVATCLVKVTDAGRYMIAHGMAYGFYLEDIVGGSTALSLSYVEMEQLARQEKRGLWPVWLGERR